MNQKGFQELYDKYKDKITDPDVKRDFDELYSISKENDVLLVTVVGSLKAGKSTFFNCIINENQDISETKPEECTIRPNFVVPSGKFAFRSYENVNKINIDVNEILNYLCNEKNSNIEEELCVRSKTDKDKLGDYVSQCQDKSKSYLFTSFSLNSNSNFVKKLKDKKVVFVDMPGSGGINAEFNYDPFYDSILKRTDLVLLICSSSVDISSALDKYLQFIQKNNSKIPFVLVLNDRNDKVTVAAKQEKLDQLDNWKHYLMQKNIVVAKTAMLNAHHIHVALFREQLEDENDQHKIDKSTQEFKDFENQFYAEFFSDEKIRETVKDNQNARLENQKRNFLEVLSHKIDTLKENSKDFEEKISKLVTFEKIFVEQEIAAKIVEHSKGVKDQTDISEDKDFDDQKFWLMKRIREKLKKYHEVVKSNVQTFVSEQCTILDKKLSESAKNEFKIDVNVEMDEMPLLESDFSKRRYNSCIKRHWLGNYDKNDYSNARQKLRTIAFAVEGYLQQCFNKMREKYVNELGRVTKHTENDELLRNLRDLKTELSK
ncbi:MAG: GTPase domain-containing protein [Bacteroidales bacterium]|nr:GTPase domain-containing protein [Bacteroidales bacterium]